MFKLNDHLCLHLLHKTAIFDLETGEESSSVFFIEICYCENQFEMLSSTQKRDGEVLQIEFLFPVLRPTFLGRKEKTQIKHVNLYLRNYIKAISEL